MKRADEHIRALVKAMNEIGMTRGLETVFRDWCHCFALSIANTSCPFHDKQWESRERRYLEIIGKYSKDEVARFPTMCADLSEAFEVDTFQDHPGRVYMELFGGQKRLGQCFTPMPVCHACAVAAIEPVDGETRTCADEACGGGAMLIAACQVYREHSVDYQRWLKITAGDIDSLCVHMCYIQLSLIGARAMVYHADALTRDTWDCFVTPMEYMWPMKYMSPESEQARKPETPTPTTKPKRNGQLELF